MTRSELPQWTRLLALSAMFAATAGCHSAFVQTSVINHTGTAVHLLELDYPSASFGTGELAADATFHYRFKILGNGPVKITWTDAAGHEHNAKGPDLREGQEGSLTVTLSSGGAAWQFSHQAASR